jgi:hypothetical protein
MKRNERRRTVRKESLPVEQQKSSTWWEEGTEDMVRFPCSHDMMHPHDHTIHEHTLRSTRCPIATYQSPQEDRRTLSPPHNQSSTGSASDTPS